MLITAESTVADIATYAPATIRVFQRHQIDFCCGGRVALATVCAERALDTDALVAELEAAAAPQIDAPSWADATLSSLVAHIQRRYHQHLREELPQIEAMLDKVVSRHGDHLPGVLLPLQRTFVALQAELLDHMEREDLVLFPSIVALETGRRRPTGDAAAWIASPIASMESDHERAGVALRMLRDLTDGYTPPEWACPTFRGLYYGLSQLEADMHVHVHLENHILFPRAAQLAAQSANT